LRITPPLLLILIGLSISFSPVAGSDVAITFDGEQLLARMVLTLRQNMTSFPNEAVTLDGSQNADIRNAFSAALSELDPNATFSNLRLDLFSNSTILNVTATMIVLGVAERQGDIAAVNMAWKAFNISRDLRVGNLSYNAVGRVHLRPVMDFYVNASQFENEPNATIRAVTFFSNETQSVPGPNAANEVGNFTLLDFRALSLPLDQWTRSYNLENNTTTWRYTPPVRLATSVRAQELNKTILIEARYSYDVEVSVPGLARAVGDFVHVDVGTGMKEWIMVGVVMVSIAAVIVVQLQLRARKKALKFRRRQI